jgi:hypothetical protein
VPLHASITKTAGVLFIALTLIYNAGISIVSGKTLKMLFVSKYNHCLYDILEALIPEINRQNPFDYLHRGPKTHR